MKRIAGLIVAAGALLGLAAPASAQVAVSVGPYGPSIGIGTPYYGYGGYGLGGYGLGGYGYGAPGVTVYSSGYRGLASPLGYGYGGYGYGYAAPAYGYTNVYRSYTPYYGYRVYRRPFGLFRRRWWW